MDTSHSKYVDPFQTTMVTDCLTGTCGCTSGLAYYFYNNSSSSKPTNGSGCILTMGNTSNIVRLAIHFDGNGSSKAYVSTYVPGVTYGSWAALN